MPVEDLGQRLVDGAVQGVDRAVALGRGAPVVVAGIEDDGAATPGVRARGDRPAGELDRWRGGVGRIRHPVYLRVAVAGSSAGTSDDVVVKWRSSRRRSSAPDFQMAYSSESARAAADAAMMLVSLPIVDQVRAPSCESMITRVRAAVAASPSRMRTL